MPTRADIQAATPKCPKQLWHKLADNKTTPGPCLTPLRYVAKSNRWDCPSCRGFTPGEVIADRLHLAIHTPLAEAA